jgi:hypothetical protein
MNYQRRIEVPAGTTQTIVLPEDLNSLPFSLNLTPASGGTLSIQVSCDDQRFIETNPSLVSWSNFNPSSVTDSTLISIATPLSAIKVTATTAAGVVNIKAFKVPYSY